MDISSLTIASFQRGLAAKEFSVREVVSSYLDAIAAHDQNLHSYLSVFPEEALMDADRIDGLLKEGELQTPLAGVPLALKDNLLYTGHPATAGSRILELYVSTYDATAVSRLKSQGAIILGKTNLDEFAMGSSTENSAFGATKNPHDESRVPGGSSGGSASAVAAGFALGALGSDTGGSIRQPAAFSGVVGLKPTYGRVSRHGLIAMASSLDQIGPFTKTVEDAAILFSAIQGQDRYDATTIEGKPFEFQKKETLKGVRVGVPKEYFGEGIDADVSTKITETIALMQELGANIQEISLSNSHYGLAAYYILMPAEVSSNLARFDGIRYGLSVRHAETLLDVYTKSRHEGFGVEVKRRVMLGTHVLSAGYYDAYYAKAQRVRVLIREDFEKAFQDVDIVVGPTTPTPAFLLGERTKDPLSMYFADMYTVGANLAGLPGISIPCGTVARDGKNLPVGFQMIGKWFNESLLLSSAHAVEQALRGI